MRFIVPHGGGVPWPDTRALRVRRRAQLLGRALTRVDVWILIAAIAGVVAK